MGIEQAQRIVNQLNKDLVSLERKMADLVKKEADKTKKIGTTQRSITKNTSASMLRTKSHQIETYQKDLAKVLSDKADINKKMADKRKKLSDATLKLQKQESTQANSLAKKQEKVYATYEKQISELTKQVTEQSAIATSSDNIFNSDGTEEFDVFLSHAAEDKEGFCNEFSNILQEQHGLKVWYDSISIKWGDSIRAEIDKGLKKSRFGVVILSRSYIKKYWTNYELEALFQIESNGGKVILPIWHDITKKEIQDFSPTLAGKLAMNTGMMTPDEIAEKLNEIYQSALED
ncbi:TPA: TIR domain-containing protein [Listeria innocua]|uniref:toll/interleukin-1 receptor domain-containing protein n=1 Tax=Listeria TaxID=1637 RepID=UPI00074D5F6B|nr:MULTISPECIES: toll/interleukin-1 receptor domain-containing protein [Listeria]QPQ95728.1 TIR domain-containing protein [Listeria welshimeri]ARM73381.1 hypothetical protein LMxysn_1746 [Listeria monocytogenes]ECB9807275.1 TIR domain-containing protein [Listeria monocytogenes]ECQ6354639.1 TIR domain-containing protein [Listeria innocua]EDE2199216.1 TIR domain-containing protein [Listeria monocytogenes]